jgi:SAM-dependent methyltransferase
MNKKWNAFLVDPIYKNELELEINEEKNGDVISGFLNDNDHYCKYKIENSVPRFENRTDNTVLSFNTKWRQNFSKTFGNKPEERNHLKEQLLSLFHLEEEQRLQDIFRDNTNCLDAGCGLGWAEYLFNVNKNCNRFAIDISTSVGSVFEKTKEMENVCVVNGSIFHLPFRENFFDVVFSNGVIHHTGNSIRAFRSLAASVKNGGILAIYVYCNKPFMRGILDRKIRSITINMEDEECMDFSKQITKFGKSLSDIKQDLIINEDIPLLGIKKGTYNLQRFIYDYFIKCYYNKELGDEVSDITNFDWYSPEFVNFYSEEELYSLFKAYGFKDIKIIQPQGWEYSGYFAKGVKK